MSEYTQEQKDEAAKAYFHLLDGGDENDLEYWSKMSQEWERSTVFSGTLLYRMKPEPSYIERHDDSGV